MLSIFLGLIMEYDYINNRNWMYEYTTRSDHFFINGVVCFVEFTFRNDKKGNGVASCSCKKWGNRFLLEKEILLMHILENGFIKYYTTWEFHGECSNLVREDNKSDALGDDIEGMVHDAVGGDKLGRDQNAENFEELLKEAKQPIYVGCMKYTNLSFMVHFLHIKCKNRLSNKAFSEILKFIKDLLPEDNILSKSWYESKKMMAKLGLEMNKIHACPNDCMLFRDDYQDLDECPIENCHASRWEEGKKNVPAKVLRHFPLIPRLQRLLMSAKTAGSMKWHQMAPRSEEGKMSHLRDSPAWKYFDKRHSTFSSDPCNVRLDLASDGFGPFKVATGASHST